MLQRKRTQREKRSNIAPNDSSSSDSSSDSDSIVFVKSFPLLESGTSPLSSINLSRSRRRLVPKRRRAKRRKATPSWSTPGGCVSPHSDGTFNHPDGGSHAVQADLYSMDISLLPPMEASPEDRSLDSVTGTLESCPSTGRHSNAETAIVSLDDKVCPSLLVRNSSSAGSGQGSFSSKRKDNHQIHESHTVKRPDASSHVFGGHEVSTASKSNVTPQQKRENNTTCRVTIKCNPGIGECVPAIHNPGHHVASKPRGHGRKLRKQLGAGPPPKSLGHQAIENDQGASQTAMLRKSQVIPTAIRVQKDDGLAMRDGAPLKRILSKKVATKKRPSRRVGVAHQHVKQAKERIASNTCDSKDAVKKKQSASSPTERTHIKNKAVSSAPCGNNVVSTTTPSRAEVVFDALNNMATEIVKNRNQAAMQVNNRGVGGGVAEDQHPISSVRLVVEDFATFSQVCNQGSRSRRIVGSKTNGMKGQARSLCKGAGDCMVNGLDSPVDNNVKGGHAATTYVEKNDVNVHIKAIRPECFKRKTRDEGMSTEQCTNERVFNMTCDSERNAVNNHSSHRLQKGGETSPDNIVKACDDEYSSTSNPFFAWSNNDHEKLAECWKRLGNLAKTLDEHESRILRTGDTLGLWNERSKVLARDVTAYWVNDSHPEPGCCWQEDFSNVLRNGRPETKYLVNHDQY